MAGKLKRQYMYSQRPGSTKYIGVVRCGANGTPTTDSDTSTPGFTVTRLYAGRFKVVFDEPILGLIGFNGSIKTDSFHNDGYVVNIDDVSSIVSDRFLMLRVDDAYGAEQRPRQTTMFLEFTVKTSEQG